MNKLALRYLFFFADRPSATAPHRKLRHHVRGGGGVAPAALRSSLFVLFLAVSLSVSLRVTMGKHGHGHHDHHDHGHEEKKHHGMSTGAKVALGTAAVGGTTTWPWTTHRYARSLALAHSLSSADWLVCLVVRVFVFVP